MALRVKITELNDFPVVSCTTGTTLDIKTGSWKYSEPVYRNKTAPCNQACPTCENIEGYMLLAKQGEFKEAWKLIKQENPFPAVCGRVCFHPCESACNRKDFDDPLRIHLVERFIGDFGLKQVLERPSPNIRFKEKIAVIGSGPAGLSCAYQLARLGYKATVYEAASLPGGLLRLGIPEYRLPRDILDAEIDYILKCGVEIVTNTKIGKDISFDELKATNDAVFIGIGVHKSSRMKVENEDAEGVMSGLEYLRRVNMGEKVELEGKVAVIGGGNTAMDAARVALRKGAKPFILYRRTQAEMPAHEEEIQAAMQEGIPMTFLAAPTRIITQNGKVAAMQCIKMRLGEPDASGRRRPVPIAGSEYTIGVDHVLTAIGEYGDVNFIKDMLDIDWATIKTDELGRTSLSGVYAGGDIIDIDHTVTHAIGSGKRAALAIHHDLRKMDTKHLLEKYRVGTKGNISMERFLHDKPFEEWEHEVVGIDKINLNYFETETAQAERKLPAEDRVGDFAEVNKGLSFSQLMQEVKRCFNCAVCNQCDNCLVFCPDVAIHRNPNGGYIIDYDYCKGCGVCVRECPRNAISIIKV